MATTIANLSINLIANTAKLQKGFTKGKAQTKTFGSQLRRVGKLLGKTLVVAAAAAAAAFANLVRRQFAVIDLLGKTSRQIGISVATLNALQFAGKKAGASTEEVSKGLTKLLKSAGDARDGLLTTKKAFEDIGVSVEDLEGLSAEKLFERVSKGLDGLDDSQRRTQVSMTLMGRSGTKLLEVFAGFEEAQRRLKRLGAFINDEDALKVEAANDAFLDMQTTVTGFAQRTAVTVAPAVQELSESFTDLMTGDFGDFLLTDFNERITSLAELAQALTVLSEAAGAAEDVFANLEIPDQVSDAVETLIDSVSGVVPVLRELKLGQDIVSGLASFSGDGASATPTIQAPISQADFDRINNLAAISDEAADAQFALAESSSKLIEKLQLEADGFGKSAERAALFQLELKGLDQQQLAVIDGLIKEKEAREEANREWEKFKGIAARVFESVKTPMERFKDELEKLRELRDRTVLGGGISEETFGRAAKAEADKLKSALGLDTSPGALGDAGSPGAFQRGSVAAFSKGLDLDRQRENALTEAKKHTVLLGDIRDDLSAADRKVLSLP